MLDSAIQVLNEFGETWWSHVFALTWTSSLVAAILLAVVWVGRRWPAQLRYAIVLIALIKFAVPPTLTAPVGLFRWFGPTIMERTEPPALTDQSIDSEPDNFSWSAILSAWKQLNWHAHLMLLHVIGSVLAGVWAISRLAKLVGMAHRARYVTTGKWYDLFARLSKQLGLSRPVSLLVSSEAAPPIAFGLLRPCVMVPGYVLRDMPLRQIKTMLAHELAHHKRADLWINALQNILGVLWWFNPLVRLLNLVLRHIREDCCDDLLLCRKIAIDSKYCQTLLQIASNLNRSARMIAALGFAETIHPLGRRIKRIMDPKVYRWTRLSFGTVASVAILAALLLPGLRSERPTTSADTPLVLEVLAPSEPQAAAGLAEKPPTNTQDRTEEFAGSFPQQIEGVQPRNYPTVEATSKIAVASANPEALKTVDSADSWNQDKGAYDSITDIIMTVAARDLDPVKEQSSRRDNSNQSTPLLSFVFPEYSGGSDGGGGSGSVAADALASDVFASRYVVEESSANLTAILFVQDVSEQYSFYSSTLETLRPINRYEYTTDWTASLEWSGPLAVFDPTILSLTTEPSNPSDGPPTGFEAGGTVLALASSAGAPTLNAIVAATDTDLDAIESAALADGEVLAMIDLADSLDLIHTSEARQTASSTLVTISQSQIDSGGKNMFDLAWAAGAMDTGHIMGQFDAFSPIPDAIATNSMVTTPEPMTIWVLLVGSLLLMHRRQKTL